MQPAPGPRWRWQWGALVVVALIVMEITTRVEDRIAAGIPMLSRVSGPGDLIWLDTVGARGRPNAKYRNWSLNGLGFRGPEVSARPAAGVTRIVTIGASETFGLYERPGREFPRQLEDSLRARGCTSVEVVNAALPGMALPSMAQLLDRVVRPVGASHLILYPSPAFYLNRRGPEATRGEAGADTTLPASRVLVPRIRERASTQLKSLVPEPVKTVLRRTIADRGKRAERRAHTFPTGRLESLEHDLRSTVGVARSLGVPVTLAGHVNATMQPGFNDPALLTAWEYQFPAVSGDVIVEFHRRARVVAEQVARDSSVAYVDLTAAIGDSWEASFADFVHFTDSGAARVASTLASALASTSCPMPRSR